MSQKSHRYQLEAALDSSSVQIKGLLYVVGVATTVDTNKFKVALRVSDIK